MLIFLMIIASCTKNFPSSNRNGIPSSAGDSTITSSSRIKPNPDYMPGSCPYVCTDSRCKAYLNGYCGPDTIAVITNSSNYYDYIGGQHNAGLSYVMRKLGGGSTDNSAILTQVENYMDSIGYSTSTVASGYSSEVTAGYMPFTDIPDLDTLGTIMYNSSTISSTANSYIQHIFSIFEHYANDSLTSTIYTSFCDSLITLESSINSNAYLTTAEKTNLLAACAVGRYSGSYWGSRQSSLSINARKVSSGSKFLFSWKVWKIIICDVAGAVAGMTAGPIVATAGAVGASVAASPDNP